MRKPFHTANTSFHWSVVVVLACSIMTGCDSVQPSKEGTLLVEAFLEAGQPLPPIRVARTWSASTRLTAESGGISGADVELVLDGTTYPYAEDPDTIGLYRPDEIDRLQLVAPYASFSVHVRADDDQASAVGMIPPVIIMRDIVFSIPDEAIEAVFLDSLNIGLDSLNLAVDARQGFIYPVQVDLSWDVPPSSESQQNEFWIETRLEPRNQFSSSIIDFFLLREQILPENAIDVDSSGSLRWSGVYAIPVETATTQMPEHKLKAILVRGDPDFARFEASTDNPERREPLSNVVGGIGFVGGISIDSLTVTVK